MLRRPCTRSAQPDNIRPVCIASVSRSNDFRPRVPVKAMQAASLLLPHWAIF